MQMKPILISQIYWEFETIQRCDFASPKTEYIRAEEM